MAKIITLKDHKTNELAYPQTVSDAVYMDNGSTLEQYKESVARQFANYPNVTVTGTVTNFPDNEDIRETEQHTLQLADRNNLEGMGYVILRKNKSFAEQVVYENTIYEIRYDFDLDGESVTIPDGCVLKFNGGSINHGTLNGTDTRIDGGNYGAIGCDVSGTFVNGSVGIDAVCKEGDVITQDVFDRAHAISETILFARKDYNIDNLVLDNCSIIGDNTNIVYCGENDRLLTAGNNVLIDGFTFNATPVYGGFIYASLKNNITIRNCSFIETNMTESTTSENTIELDDTGDIEIDHCRFIDGWNDHEYDATTVGGRNIHNAIRVWDHGQSNVKITDCYAKNVWTLCNVLNVNNLLVEHNHIEDTADTGIFDRCTSGNTKNKRVIGNTLINIGKTPIKILDTNTNSDLVNTNAIVAENYIRNYGLHYADCTAILSANAYDSGGGGYINSATSRNKYLIVSNNTIIADASEGSTLGFILGNCIDNIIMTGNTFTCLNDTERHIVYLPQYSNGVFSNNDFTFNGTLAWENLYGKVVFSGNKISGATVTVRTAGSSATAAEVSKVIFTNNIVDTKLTSLAPESGYYNGWALICNRQISVVTGNIFECAAQYPGDSVQGHYGPLNVEPGSLVDNNTFVFSDTVKHAKSVGGDLFYPSYYRGLIGTVCVNSDETIGYISGNTFGSRSERSVPFLSSGNASTRPTGVPAGFMHFATELSPARPIFYTGSGWVDATGTPV